MRMIRCHADSLVRYGRIIVLIAWPVLAVAQTDDPIQSGKQALADTRQPWYDPDSDELRPYVLDQLQEPSDRADWRGVQRPDWSWNWNWNWNFGFSWVGELFKLLAWATLIGLLALLVYALVKTFLNLDPLNLTGDDSNTKSSELRTDDQRIENLPVQPSTRQGSFLELARQHYQAADFSEAIVYLFSHQLLQLDKAGLVRLTKGKTNRQYLSELRHSDELRSVLGQTTVAFEDVFFGKHTLTRERFERCWKRNEDFQLMIQRATG